MTTVWQYLVGHSEPIALWASVVAAFGGFVALVIVWRFWSWLEPHYQEYWAKCAVAFFRALAAVSAIAAKPAPLDPSMTPWEQPWAPTLAMAAFGYLCWEVAGARGDQQFKRGKERTAEEHAGEIAALKATQDVAIATLSREVDEATQDRVDAEFEATRLGWLLTHLRDLANFKLRRVREVATAAATARTTIQQARTGLAPMEQVRILLEGLASLFRMQVVHEDGSRHTQNFRIGLFAEKGGHLVPLAGFDLATKSHDPFSSYTHHSDRYRLDNGTDPSHAVRCVREGRALIVADCAAEKNFYIHERQPNYLRSMIAFPIASFCPDGIAPVPAALLVDTNVAGFFNEEDREMLETLLGEFVVRIDLEYAIGGLIGDL